MEVMKGKLRQLQIIMFRIMGMEIVIYKQQEDILKAMHMEQLQQ